MRQHRHSVNHTASWRLADLAEKKTSTVRAALYARVSTLNHGQDPELQLAELREYAARRGLEIIGEYVDHGISGSKESRPALNRLMADAHQRKFDAVLVWKIDRFGRSLKHLVNSLADLAAVRSLHQLARQSRPEHSIRPPHVPDHRSYGRV